MSKVECPEQAIERFAQKSFEMAFDFAILEVENLSDYFQETPVDAQDIASLMALNNITAFMFNRARMKLEEVRDAVLNKQGGAIEVLWQQKLSEMITDLLTTHKAILKIEQEPLPTLDAVNEKAEADIP